MAPTVKAQELPKSANAPPADSVTHQRYRIGGAEAAFTVTAGTLPLNDAKGERQASMFYTAYVRDGAPRDKRPISFVFNGGPGASSAYLHIGAMGPRVVDFGSDGKVPAPPGRLIDNPDTWLDLSDLVFVDPIGTGYSRAAADDGAKRYWGVKEDLASLARFIELYLIRTNRLISPKYLVGESYGGFRAARLPQLLASERGIGLAGVFLVSPLLEFRLASSDSFDALPDALRLPSYAAVKAEQPNAPAPPDLSKVEQFALGDYLSAMTGPASNDKKLDAIYQAVADYTGLAKTVVAQNGGRIPVQVFTKELRRGEKQMVSAYDGTSAAPDPYPFSDRSEGDPVYDGLRLVLSNSISDYLGDKLGVKTELPYRLANNEAARNWNWWSGLFGHGGYPGSADELREAMAINRSLKVVIAHGATDLVTPYFATKYVIDHLPSAVTDGRISFRLYSGGHMMYIRPASRTALHADAAKLLYPAPAK